MLRVLISKSICYLILVSISNGCTSTSLQGVEILFRKDSLQNVTLLISNDQVLEWTYPKGNKQLFETYSIKRYDPSQGLLDSIQTSLDILKNKKKDSFASTGYKNEIDFVLFKSPYSSKPNVNMDLGQEELNYFLQLQNHLVKGRYQTSNLSLNDSTLYLCPSYLE